MPFADYFGSWLFGLVADRATRWFTNALIGDEVDRAVRQAALAAAGRAAQELLPDDVLDRDRAAGLLIGAIDDAFAGGPDNGAAEPSAATLLEAVNSGIAARESGESFGEAGVLNQLGRLEVEQARDTPMPTPDQERARTYLTTALDLYASVKSDVGQAEVLNNLARLALASANTAEARTYLKRALAQAGSAEPERARAFESIGLCQLKDGERDQGLATLRQALEIYRAVGSPYAGRVEKIINDS